MWNDEEALAALAERLGGIPVDRIRLDPRLGTATEADLIHVIDGPEKWPVELIEGTLVDVALSFRSSVLSSYLGHRVTNYVDDQDLGISVGMRCPFRFSPGLVLLANYSLVNWERIPGEEVPDESIASFIPNLIAEVLRPDNTRREMMRKLDAYFAAGVQVVWIVDPQERTASIYDSPRRCVEIGIDDKLTAGNVLPNFRLPMCQVFDSLVPRSKRG